MNSLPNGRLKKVEPNLRVLISVHFDVFDDDIDDSAETFSKI